MAAKQATWGTIRKLPSGRWQARYREPDGTRHSAPVTFTTKAQARAWLDTRHAEILTGRQLLTPELSPAAKTPARAGVTLKQWTTRRLHEMETQDYSPNTIRSIKSRMDAHVLPTLGGLDITRIDPDTVASWREQLTGSRSAVENAQNALSSIMGAAVKARLIETNPVAGANLPARPKSSRRREIRVATRHQFETIAANMPPALQVTVLLGAWCGLRFGEIAALTRSDIDLEAGTVKVSKTVRRGVGGHQTIGPPKTAAGRRVVAIPAPCLAALEDHLAMRVADSPGALVVHQPGQPGKLLTNKTLHTYFGPACVAAGLEGFRFHDLRHTGLTMAGLAGATIAELMARAGHATPDMALIYQHASLERDRELAARMARM